jgi:hypothetical protein
MLTMKRLYELADDWKEERLKTHNGSWKAIIETDFVVVTTFLSYVWAQ